MDLQTLKDHTSDPALLTVLQQHESLLLALITEYLQEIVDQAARDPSRWIYPLQAPQPLLWKVLKARPHSRLFQRLDHLREQAKT